MSFCLPKNLTKKIQESLNTKGITAEDISNMTSAERLQFFKDALDSEGTAKNVHQSFEKSKQFQKMMTSVSTEEADNIIKLTQEIKKADALRQGTPARSPERIEYGNKYLDLSDYVESLKPQGKIFTLNNLINLPKSALTSILHFSASFVQGWGMMTTRPFWEAFGEQFKYFASEKAYRDLNASIISHPDYKIAQGAKLGLTNLGDKLNTREEAIQSSILEHVPVLNKLVKASSRAFTGFLNYTRFARFEDLINSARLNGEDISVSSKATKDIAKAVNDFTGRGALGKGDKYANTQASMNTLFFSPRKISATIEMFDPITYLDPNVSKTARIARIRQLTGSILATSAVLSLASAMGAKVETNPTSTNFMKIQVGKTTFDMTAGNAIYVRLWARLATGQMTSAKGKTTSLTSGKFGSQTRASLAINFLRDKLSPTAGALADFLYGTDPIGNPFSVTQEMKDKLEPIVVQDFIDMANTDPENTAKWLPAISAIFGVSIGTPQQK